MRQALAGGFACYGTIYVPLPPGLTPHLLLWGNRGLEHTFAFCLSKIHSQSAACGLCDFGQVTCPL